MGPEWIGRKLRVAGPALAARFSWELEQKAVGQATISRPSFPPITASFLDELGRWLQAGGTDATVPFARTCGLLRLPGEGPSNAILPELAHLDRLVRTHVGQLPGAEQELDRRIHDVMRATARSVTRIHAALLKGRPNAVQALFGGVAVLSLTGIADYVERMETPSSMRPPAQ